MGVKHHYYIPFIGLKDGEHDFQFEMDEAFFADFENADVEQCDLEFEVYLKKRSTMLELEMVFTGTWLSQCDRCGDPLEIEVQGHDEWLVKFGPETDDSNEEIWIFGPNEYQIDLKQRMYELVMLSIPTRKVHEISQCNPVVIATMDQYSTEQDSNSAWIELKNLKLETQSESFSAEDEEE